MLLQTSSLTDIMQEFEEIEEEKNLRRQQNGVGSEGKTRNKQIKKNGLELGGVRGLDDNHVLNSTLYMVVASLNAPAWSPGRTMPRAGKIFIAAMFTGLFGRN